MKNTLEKISQKDFASSVIFNSRIVKVGCLFVILFLSILSYGRAFDYYFWRDDTKVVWMQKHVPALINNFGTLGTARGRIGAVFYDFLEYTFFGFESYPHQLFGFFIRLLNIFILYFFVNQLVRSKKVAVVSCLLAAPFIGGLEAYSWVRGIGVMITLALLSFTFYLKSYYSNRWFWYALAAFTASVSLSMDMWRTMGLLFVISIWEFLHLLTKSPIRSKGKSILRVCLFLLIQIGVLKLMLAGTTSAGGSVASSANGYVTMALEGKTWQHFVASIGNLVRTPFLFVMEEGGITDAGFSSVLIGLIPLVSLIILAIRFLIKRETNLISWIVLLVWIPVFYGPNWLYAQKLEVASTHRYIAFSSIVIPILWSRFFVTKLPAKLGFIAICAFIVFSYSHAQRIVGNDYTVRGSDVVLLAWRRVISDTPLGETNQMLSVTGDNRVVGYVFAWSDIFPFATFKNIGSPSQLPIYADPKIASKVLCQKDTLIPDPITGNFRVAGNNFSIDKAYAWYIKDINNITETTDEFRVNIAKESPCLWKALNFKFNDFIATNRVSIVPQKQIANGYTFLSEWTVKNVPSDFYYIVSVSEKGKNVVPMDTRIGRVQSIDNSTVFSQRNLVIEDVKNKEYVIELSVCNKACTSDYFGPSMKINLNDLLPTKTP